MKRKILILLLLTAAVFSGFKLADASASSPTGMALYESGENNFEVCSVSDFNSPKKYQVKITPEISSTAVKESRAGETDLEKTMLLYEYVSENYDYELFSNWRNSEEILKSSSGDCADQSVLLTALLRSIGIESYVVEGNGHAWTAVHLEDNWIQIDPTSDNFWHVESCLNSKCENHGIYEEADSMFNEEKVFVC
ncbi:MAG: transglutaminase-like domain-containing protein [Candidatus Undinarchaeales archaeon]